jgi:hypothetical protein
MGKRRESYDMILNRLMDIIEGKAKKWLFLLSPARICESSFSIRNTIDD